MNFLQICQTIAREIGKAGTGPSTVVSQTGELGDIVRWAAEAYVEIQNRHGGKWRWLRKGFSLRTVALQDVYDYADCTDDVTGAAITRFGSWYINDYYNPPKIYTDSIGIGSQTWLIYTDWNDFNMVYRIGTQNPSKPVHVTINPNDDLVLGPKPLALTTSIPFSSGTVAFTVGQVLTGATSGATGTISVVTLSTGSWGAGTAAGTITLSALTSGAFTAENITDGAGGSGVSTGNENTITGEYYRSPQNLAADADIPEMPTQFHWLIVWYAIEHYGHREAASEVLTRAYSKSKTYMRQLEHHQMPRMRTSEPLV